jgi:hypothetical protein
MYNYFGWSMNVVADVEIVIWFIASFAVAYPTISTVEMLEL